VQVGMIIRRAPNFSGNAHRNFEEAHATPFRKYATKWD